MDFFLMSATQTLLSSGYNIRKHCDFYEILRETPLCVKMFIHFKCIMYYNTATQNNRVGLNDCRNDMPRSLVMHILPSNFTIKYGQSKTKPHSISFHLFKTTKGQMATDMLIVRQNMMRLIPTMNITKHIKPLNYYTAAVIN